jgi:hypothetical protein
MKIFFIGCWNCSPLMNETPTFTAMQTSLESNRIDPRRASHSEDTTPLIPVHIVGIFYESKLATHASQWTKELGLRDYNVNNIIMLSSVITIKT